MPAENPKPEKYQWHCFKYANQPYHSYIYFKIIRRNAKGEIIPYVSGYYNDQVWNPETQQYENAKKPGDVDSYVLTSDTHDYQCRVCRRFEAVNKE